MHVSISRAAAFTVYIKICSAAGETMYIPFVKFFYMGAGAVIAARRRKIIRRFHEANAYDAANALNAGQHGIRMSFIFRRLVNLGVILPAGKGMYYLDAARETEVRKYRQKILFIITLLVITAGVIAYFMLNGK